MPPAEAPIESVADAVRHYTWVEHRTRSIFLGFLSGTFFVGGCTLLGLSIMQGNLQNVEGIVALAFFVPLMFQLPNFVAAARIRGTFFRQIAESFGLSFSEHSLMNTVSGHLFAFGHSRGLMQVFAGTHSGHDIRFYTYTFTTGSGKSRITHYLQVFEAECHTELPEIMVHPKTVTPGGMSWQPKGTRSLRLEGLFNKQFDVFVPEGMEIEALQVLEPQHMDMLMQQYSDIGFYTHKTKLYAFTDAPLPTTRTDFANLIALIDNLYDTLVPELHGISGDVTALREAFANGK